MEVKAQKNSSSESTPTVSLQSIWEAPLQDLKRILQEANWEPSGNINYDRASVATIYYHSGMLKPEDRQWVARQDFDQVMSNAPSLEEGIKQLEKPFQRLLLTLYASFIILRGVSRLNMRGPLSAILRNVVGINTIHSIERAHTWSQTWVNIEHMATKTYRENKEELQLPGATAEQIESAATENAWRIIIDNQAEIRSMISQIPLSNRAFNPVQVVNDLLRIDLSNVPQVPRCYYLYMISKMLQTIPLNKDLSARLTDTIDRYGCVEVFSEVPAEPLTAKGLSPLTSKVGEESEKALRALIGGLVGRPPTDSEILKRLSYL